MECTQDAISGDASFGRGETARVVHRGPLDGLTILRYAHISRDPAAGGMEQYLLQLNRALLARNRMTILQMYLVPDPGYDEVTVTESVGRGRLIWIPVGIRSVERTMRSWMAHLRYVARNRNINAQEGAERPRPGVRDVGRLIRHRGGYLRHRTAIFSERLAEFIDSTTVDLFMVHWFSYDIGALLKKVVRAKMPFAVVNHFSNRRLLLPEAAPWIMRAAAIGGVSAREVPSRLRGSFVNLSDAIDSNYFDPSKVDIGKDSHRNLILLPGRIAKGKGHRDLLSAACRLRDWGIDFTIGFAGPEDDNGLRSELESDATAAGLSGRMLFFGKLTSSELRDIYAQSCVVVLPSYAEGLGRVLLEAQAMTKPVVAYDCGGVREAMLPDQSGILLRLGDVEGLAEALRRLISESEERKRMGTCGRRFILQYFSIPAFVERHEAFCQQALQRAV